MGFWLTFFLWVASFLLTDYFRAKLPSQEPSGEGDFQSPTSTEGRKIPQVVGGTVKVKGPNTLWRGEWEAVPVTVETGVVFKDDETVGYEYYIALALGQFIGRTAGMTAIYIGDDKVWDYVADNAGAPALVADVNLPELWGGYTKGGGFVGRFRAVTGANNTVSSFLASRVTNQSAWPGMVYVVLTNLTETAGANIGEANQLRDIRIEWQCHNTIANGGLGNELSLSGDRHIIGRDANPISCAYRLLTDPDWSVSLGDIDFSNFQAAAITCYNEGIGYSRLVDSEMEAYEILAEIEKHIDGYIGPNPQTGLMEVTLARADYTPANEFQATEDNIIAINDYAKPEWPQTKNEVKIRFVNREKDYSDDHAVAQDMAGRLIAGRPQSTTLRFPGLRDADAANRIAARTARTYFWPLSKFQLEIDRTGWELRPGSVVVVTHPDIGATDLATRVTKVAVGDPVKQTIVVDVVEDVFADEVGIFAPPQPSGDVPPASAPVAVSNYYKVYAPRWLLNLNNQALEARLLWCVERDSPNTGYQIRYRTRPTPFGGNFNGELVDTSVPVFTAVGTLRSDLGQLSGPSNNNGTGSVAQGAGFYVDGNLGSLVRAYTPTAYEGLAIIEPGTLNEEFVAIGDISLDGAGVLCDNVWRAIGNSPMREHAAGSVVAFIDSGAYLQENLLQGDTSYGAQFKVTPIAQGVLGTVPNYDGEMAVDDRAIRKPYPPTAVRFTNLSSTAWYPAGTLEASGPNNLSVPVGGIPTTIWNRRFDSANAVLGANSQTDNNTFWGTNSFSDLSTTLNWFIYNLDTHPSPVRGNEILSGTVNSNNRDNTFTIAQADIEALELLAPSPINARFEFTFENGVDLDGVLTGVESESTFIDRTITYLPALLSYGAVENTVLLVHFEGFDGTTQVIDWGPYNHPVTLVGDAEIDTDIPADTGLQSGSLVIDGAGDYATIPDHAAFNFDCDTGFTIQCRVYIKSTPTGEQPLVTKWATTGDQRSWWLGLSGTSIRLKMSTTGANEFIETTGTRTWTVGQWYEITCTVYNPPSSSFTYVWFWVDGVFDEAETLTAITTLYDSTAPVRIGADGEGTTFQAANIDEVRILDTASIMAPFTLPQEEYWGREHQNPVLLNWEKGADADTTYVTDDLNHFPLQFPTGAGAQIDDAQSKFGTKSCYFGGLNVQAFDSSSRVRIPETEWSTGDYEQWFDFGVRDFTMECWVRLEVLPSTQGTSGLITKWKRGGSPNAVGSEQFNRQNWQFLFTSTNLLQFSYNINNSITTLNSDALTGLAINTWYHVAVCRKDGVLGLFWDGNRVGQDLTGFDGLWIRNHNAARVTFGGLDSNSSATSWALKGWLDEIRILNGVAAYDPLQATYTVPTAAFPVDPDPEPAPPITGLPSSWTPLNS